MKKEINTLDLFCGAGGLSEGFKEAGFNVLLGVDTNKIALETFKLNHTKSKILCKDISKVSGKEIRKIVNKKIDIIIGGAPCQGFSMAGKRDPTDKRNFLIKHFIRIVSEVKPKFFIIENVRGLISMKMKNGKKFLDFMKNLSEKRGYFIKEFLLNAADYGVPQKRRRVFLIGSRNKNFGLRLIKRKSIPVSKILLPKNKIPENYFYSKKMISGFKERAVKNKELRRGFGWQFLNLKKPSYTISARYWKDGAEALVKYSETKIRKLMPEECARIQSFPKNYKFCGNTIERYMQIGNAVPPQLAYSIAKEMK